MNGFNNKIENLPLITVLGPTASGKTQLGVTLAERFNGEIISADSRQVYRHMDIGSGKDLEEYGSIPYHLIDIVEPGYEYNLFEFVRDFSKSYSIIHEKGSVPFLVGGTGMYLDAILNRYGLSIARNDSARKQELASEDTADLIAHLLELEPNQHNKTDLEDRKRVITAILIAETKKQGGETLMAPDCEHLIIGLQFPREITRKRITERLKRRLKNGLLDEVEALNKLHDVSWKQLDFYGLEYRFVAQYLEGKLSYNDMFQKLNSAIHQFAKQQEKWFRNIEKKGNTIHWLDTASDTTMQANDLVESFLNSQG